MINILLCFLLLLVIFLAVCQLLSTRYLYLLVKQPVEKKKVAPPQAYVTPSDPSFVQESTVGQEGSSIVIPKTPQRIEWEEKEELRKLNLGQPK